MSPTQSKLDIGILIRRGLFFMVLVLLTLGNLFVMFRGLSSPHAMDQAQIAREMARGNGQSTKFIRPADYRMAEKKNGAALPLQGFKDSYHAPLNLWVNAAVFKVIGADDPEAYPIGRNEMIFHLDRVVATVSTIFFLLAIGMNYLLIARIFDAKLAGVCAIIMLFSQSFWLFSLSGLPQMLMLLLFSCGIYFLYRAIEAMNDKRPPLLHALLAGVFFTLLAMTHWVTVWIALGYILFAAIALRPRGVVGAAILVLLMIVGSFFIVRNFGVVGKPFGTGFLTLYNGLANGSEAVVMRSLDLDANPLSMQGLIRRVLSAILTQMGQIVPLLAGIIVAPVFFLSLLHPFRSRNIGMLRWAVLSMWATGALGLAFFGISDEPLDPNQIHLLFAPIMTAYGVAFITILWIRLDFVGQIPMLRNAHLIAICVLCALPMVLELPLQVRMGMKNREKRGVPHWPPYLAPVLRHPDAGLCTMVREDEVVFSDQPWAVAWYADRISIWLPPDKNDFVSLESVANEGGTPCTGILITPSSHGEQPVNETISLYRDFAALVINGGVAKATSRQDDTSLFMIHDEAFRIKDIASTYRHIKFLVGLDMILYSNRPTPPEQP